MICFLAKIEMFPSLSPVIIFPRPPKSSMAMCRIEPHLASISVVSLEDCRVRMSLGAMTYEIDYL